jgi:hypothetical protein
VGKIGMVLISETYRAQNAELHVRTPLYGCGGSKHAAAVLAFAKELSAKDILDYGCGKQTLGAMIGPSMRYRGYDPAIPHLAAMPEPADLVVCTDVMEHVESDMIEAVLSHIKRLARKGVYFAISTEPGTRKLPNGERAHCSVYSSAWWNQRLANKWNIKALSGEPVIWKALS